MLKDWRGVTLNEGDQVLWVSHWGNHWEPRVGKVVKVHEDSRTATVKRELTEEDHRRAWRKPNGTAVIPAYRLTRVDVLPLPDEEKGLTAL